jgi:hypothetical protein
MGPVGVGARTVGVEQAGSDENRRLLAASAQGKLNAAAALSDSQIVLSQQ